MAAKRAFNVNEALEYLEDLEAYSSDESDLEDEFVPEGRLVIVPPSNVEGHETDKDSAEKNGTDPNHVNKNQLLSNEHVESNTSQSNFSVYITDSPVKGPTKENDKDNRKKIQKPKLVRH